MKNNLHMCRLFRFLLLFHSLQKCICKYLCSFLSRYRVIWLKECFTFSLEYSFFCECIDISSKLILRRNILKVIRSRCSYSEGRKAYSSRKYFCSFSSRNRSIRMKCSIIISTDPFLRDSIIYVFFQS